MDPQMVLEAKRAALLKRADAALGWLGTTQGLEPLCNQVKALNHEGTRNGDVDLGVLEAEVQFLESLAAAVGA